MRRVLPLKFFQRPVLRVAPELLDKILVRRIKGREVHAVITEVEAYDGFKDKACHAHRGKTPRNAPMFDSGGIFYIYLVYGMHWMLNIVTGEEGYPAAILMRSATPVGEEYSSPTGVMLKGPGKLTKAFRIDGRLNGKRAHPSSGLWFEDWGIQVPSSNILRTPRIGVDYAGEWAEKPYRFLLTTNSQLPA